MHEIQTKGTSLMEALPDDVINALLAPTPKRMPVVRNAACDLCGGPTEQGYCINDDCERDAPEPTYPCVYCGHCENPQRCVWQNTCPLCYAEPSKPCTRKGGFTALHEERWALVGSHYNS